MDVAECDASHEVTESESSSDFKDIPNVLQMFLQTVRVVRNTPFSLPKTVSQIECSNGTKIYLIGTAHFSKESIEDVRFVIEKTLPDMVMVELCRNRAHSMLLSEDDIKRQIKENSLLSFVKGLGVSNGILQYLLLRFTSYIMDQIGIAPGGEFRAALQEVTKQPHCHIILGDRPISVTLQRAMDALNLWQKTKIFFSLVFGFEKITPEDVEEMKREDLLEQLVKAFAGDYPELTQTILEERDLYLARSIWEISALPLPKQNPQEAQKLDDSEIELRNRNQNDENAEDRSPLEDVFRCCHNWPCTGDLPRVIVAVVGIGHVAGIKRAWDTAFSIDKAQLMIVKPTSRYWVFFRWGSRTLLISSFAYACYCLGNGVLRFGGFQISRILNRT